MTIASTPTLLRDLKENMRRERKEFFLKNMKFIATKNTVSKRKFLLSGIISQHFRNLINRPEDIVIEITKLKG